MTAAKSPPLSALVFDEYGYSSSSPSDDSDYFSSSSTSTTTSSSDSSSSLVSFLSESSSWSDSLARLACAFAPPGHEIHPSDLTSAQVICVDDHHIEISAVICDTEACVTVAVPVDFPNDCPVDNLYNNHNNCVMENLQRLDERATELIRHQEWNRDHAEEQLLQTNNEEPSLQEDEIDLPSWWVSPTTTAIFQDGRSMVDECQNVKDLLNEQEFYQDLVAMATRTCTELYPLDSFRLMQTAVSMVGPAGMMVRAHVKLEGGGFGNNGGFGTDNDDDDSSSSLLVVDLPVLFSRQVGTVEDLRACVLGVVVAM
jgi:hypothetical protein